MLELTAEHFEAMISLQPKQYHPVRRIKAANNGRRFEILSDLLTAGFAEVRYDEQHYTLARLTQAGQRAKSLFDSGQAGEGRNVRRSDGRTPVC